MKYKRLEIYTGWKCNHKCTFCIEYSNIEKEWDREISKAEIMKKLIKYRKKGFNHVTFLGGEPFIHKVFGFSIKFAKKLGYTVMVTTNSSIIQFESKAEEYLPDIDQLIISIPIIDKDIQPVINGTKGIIDFDKVFNNIGKYWSGNFLKINTVINKKNLSKITDIINYIGKKGVKELSITYPDLEMPYYNKEYLLNEVTPSYSEVKTYIEEWFVVSEKNGINLILADLPICFLPDIDKYNKTEDFVYQTRLKIDKENKELDRVFISPRRRSHVKNCEGCSYSNICWGPSIHYDTLYGLDEIKKIKK